MGSDRHTYPHTYPIHPSYAYPRAAHEELNGERSTLILSIHHMLIREQRMRSLRAPGEELMITSWGAIASWTLIHPSYARHSSLMTQAQIVI